MAGGLPGGFRLRQPTLLTDSPASRHRCRHFQIRPPFPYTHFNLTSSPRRWTLPFGEWARASGGRCWPFTGLLIEINCGQTGAEASVDAESGLFPPLRFFRPSPAVPVKCRRSPRKGLRCHRGWFSFSTSPNAIYSLRLFFTVAISSRSRLHVEPANPITEKGGLLPGEARCNDDGHGLERD